MEEKRDKNGKTEEQFLREYDVTKYFRPSVTADAVLFAPRLENNGGRLLLIKRGGHPFLGDYAFPGGFLESDESCEHAAARELFEETGVKDIPLRQLVTASTPERDPRWRNITAVFYALVDSELDASGGDDADDARWFDLSVEVDKSSGERAELTLTADGVRLCSVLDVKRDAFGRVDINETEIIERGGIAFDHSKLIYYLYDLTRGAK